MSISHNSESGWTGIPSLVPFSSVQYLREIREVREGFREVKNERVVNLHFSRNILFRPL
jgi:hypothetical protein